MAEIVYSEQTFEKLSYFVDNNLILLVTATDLETENLHSQIQPLDDTQKIYKVYKGNLTFYFGKLGLYKIAHIQCAMGSLSTGSSLSAVTEALTLLNSKLLVMIGIAFGVDNKKQKIGDVLIAESVIPYNSKRVGSEKDVNRGIEMPSSPVLVNRFKNENNWKFEIETGTNAKKIFTRLLSGEELIDNITHRDELVSEYQDSKGGEMEGAGVYSACAKTKTDCILVKGICDFADGEKGKNKSENQKVAMLSAIDLCKSLFESENVFVELDVFPYNEEEVSVACADLHNILFDFYDETKEKYYIERDYDELLSGYLNNYGIWIYGPSGCGKSNLIVRNLKKLDKKYLHIDLSPCVSLSCEEMFETILFEIHEKFNDKGYQKTSSFAECNRKIINILEKYNSNQEYFLLIEEIPLSSKEEQRGFADRLFSLLIAKNKKPNLNQIKIVLSCIDDPTSFLQQFQAKVRTQLTFLNLEFWKEKDIEKLISLIINNLNLKFDAGFISQLISVSGGSPRFIKVFFRNLISINKFDDETLQQILIDTERELR